MGEVTILSSRLAGLGRGRGHRYVSPENPDEMCLSVTLVAPQGDLITCDSACRPRLAFGQEIAAIPLSDREHCLTLYLTCCEVAKIG